MEEEWKVYKDTTYSCNGRRNICGGLFEVSNLGRVKKDGELYNPKISKSGYPLICSKHLHRIVAELFIPNPENKPCIDHIDTNKLNNSVENLRWVTQKENCNNPLTRKHNSNAQSGKKLSEECKIKLSKYHIGRKRSDIVRKHISESRKGKPSHAKGRSWYIDPSINKRVYYNPNE